MSSPEEKHSPRPDYGDYRHLNEPDPAQYLKERKKVMELLRKHQIELDDASQQIIDHIVKEGVVAKGLDKILTKDWFISEALLHFKNTRDGSSKQRTLEWLAELTGVYVKDSKSGANLIADVLIGNMNQGKTT